MKTYKYIRLLKKSEGIPVGTLGTIVYSYKDGKACEVEFFYEGKYKVITLPLTQVEKYEKYENC